MPGTLYVVATPLGNLEDLSPRAAERLRSVAAIACEDTRRTAKLLARFGIETPTLSCHKFNERGRIDELVERLRSGDDLALVSDAGTPAVADPGALLVASAHEAGLDVRAVAGPSAVTAALSVSGLPADRYRFEGFLPHRAGERRRRLRELRDDSATIVVFETPHRIGATLDDLDALFGGRPIVLTRELTKQFETVRRGTAAELRSTLCDPVRGEFTLVIAGRPAGSEAHDEEPAAVRLRTLWREAMDAEGGDRRRALRATARSSGLRRSELYRRLAELGVDLDGER